MKAVRDVVGRNQRLPFILIVLLWLMGALFTTVLIVLIVWEFVVVVPFRTGITVSLLKGLVHYLAKRHVEGPTRDSKQMLLQLKML